MIQLLGQKFHGFRQFRGHCKHKRLGFWGIFRQHCKQCQNRNTQTVHPKTLKAMKHIFLFLLILALLSCKKEGSEELKFEKTFAGAMEWGWVKASRNGESWQASTSARFHVADSNYVKFSILTFSKEGFNREALSLNEVPLKVGRYPIKGDNSASDFGDGFVGSGYAWVEDDGDVAGPIYDHDDTLQGFLELTTVDTVAKKIAGNFDRMVFKMRITPSTQFAPEHYPQTAVFENGSFEMSIIE